MATRPASASIPRPHKAQAHLVRILIYTLLVFWSLVCLFPLYWVVITSLKGGPEIVHGPLYLPFVDFTPTLEAWAVVLTYSNDHLLLRFFNSVIVGTTSTLLTILFGGMVSMAETNCARRRRKSVPVWLREKGHIALGSGWFVGVV